MPIIRIKNKMVEYWAHASVKSGYVYLDKPDVSDFAIFVELEA